MQDDEITGARSVLGEKRKTTENVTNISVKAALEKKDHELNSTDSPCVALQSNQSFKRISSALIWHFAEFFPPRH